VELWAALLSVYEDTETTVVGYRSRDQYVVFSSDRSPDEQDVKLGLSGLHLEVGEQSRAAYNAVDQFVLRDEMILLVKVSSHRQSEIECDQIVIRADGSVAFPFEQLKKLARMHNIGWVEVGND
jgi:hypothetical protein